MTGPEGGHDGPYAAPIQLTGGTVLPEWIDDNGHMNVAYYVLAFDGALDQFFEMHLGLGASHRTRAGQGPYALQSSIHYLSELLEGEAFSFRACAIDADAKRLHVMLEMLAASGAVAATYEQILMNVDLTARKSAPYPDWGQKRLQRMVADHAELPRPAQFAQPLGLRRSG